MSNINGYLHFWLKSMSFEFNFEIISNETYLFDRTKKQNKQTINKLELFHSNEPIQWHWDHNLNENISYECAESLEWVSV